MKVKGWSLIRESVIYFSLISIFVWSVYSPVGCAALAMFMFAYSIYIGSATSRALISIYAVFISLYFLYIIPYFLLGISFASRTTFQDFETSRISLWMISYFVFVFFQVLKSGNHNKVNLSRKITQYDNPLFFYSCAALVLVFASFMVNFKGTIVNSSYSELTENRYAFIGYAPLLLLIGWCSCTKKYKRLALLFVGGIYLAVCLLYGYRLRFINMSILIYLLYFESFLSKRSVFYLSILMVFLMLLLGTLRHGTVESLNAMLGIKDDVIISNQGGVFLTSNIYFGAAAEGFITLKQRFFISIQYFTGAFVPSGLFPDEYVLSKRIAQLYDIPGGGFITAYAYVFGGYFLVALSPFLASYCVNVIYEKPSLRGARLAYCVIVAIMFVNWLTYKPIVFFKMAVYCAIGFVIFKEFCRFFKKRERLLSSEEK